MASRNIATLRVVNGARLKTTSCSTSFGLTIAACMHASPRVADAEAKLAVDAAAKAFPAWSQTTPAERARLFFKAAEIVKRRRAEIAEILAIETGSTISFATFQQDLVAATLEQAAGWMYLPKGEVLETNIPGTHSIGVRRPLGVVASFTPWNGANVLSWRAVISPVAAGNTVVVKPSELAPISAGIILAQIAEEAGFPEESSMW